MGGWNPVAAIWISFSLAFGTWAKADTFAWREGTSGSFDDFSRWTDHRNQSFDPPDPNPLHRTPGSGDIISFPQDQGDFTVTIGSASVAGTAIFDSFTGGIVTLNTTGIWQLGDSQIARVRFTGEGTVRSNRILIYDSVLSGVDAEFADLRIEHHPPLDVPSLLLEAGAALVTTGPLMVNGFVDLDGSSWNHSGIMPGGDLRLRNGSRLMVREAAVEDEPSLPRLVVESGSIVEMDDIVARVDASGASSVSFGRALLHSTPAHLNPAGFSDAGTTLTVADRLTVSGGPLQFRAGARLQTVNLSHDQGAFSTEAIDSGSTVAVTGLLDSGLVAARIGGSATVAVARNALLEAAGAGSGVMFNILGTDAGGRAEFSAAAGGTLTGGAVDAGMGRVTGKISGSGSHLGLSGTLEAGGLHLTVTDGGRMDCDLIAAGSLEDSTIAVTGADSLLLAGGGMILGEGPHTTSLSVTEGGRVQSGAAGNPDSLMAVGVSGGAEASVLVLSGGVLDTRLNGEFGLGIAASGTLNVRQGGRVLAADLTLGVLPGGKGSATGSGNGSSCEITEMLRVGREGEGTVTLSDQFLVTAGTVAIGDSAADNVLTVTTGAAVQFAKALFAGNVGRGTIRLTDGGIVRGIGSQPRIGIGEASAGAVGVLDVSGMGSRVATQDRGILIVGSVGQGTLQVRDGGTVEAAIASIGGAGGSSGTATLSGAGSLWSLSNSLDVGGFNQPVPGSLTVGAGTSVQIRNFLGVTSAGVIALQGGTVSVGEGSAASGTLRVGSGGTLRLGGRVTGGKIVIGQGGRIEPGSSPGTGRAESGFELEPGGTLEMEIGGTDAGVTFDQLAVSGVASLNGSIRLTFVNGFAPTAGQVFDLITAGSLEGAPGPITVSGLEDGFGFELRPGNDGRLQLAALTAGIASSKPVSPDLSIASINGLVVVSWPAELTGWILQSSTSLRDAPWSNVDAPAHRLTLPPADSYRFFRLAHP